MKGTVFMVVATLAALQVGAAEIPALVPMPHEIEVKEGVFAFNPADIAGAKWESETGATVTEAAAKAAFARVFADVKAEEKGFFARLFGGSKISFKAETTDDIPAEGYDLDTTDGELEVDASSEAGFFYAAQTLKQLIDLAGSAQAVPCVEIEDRPRYSWRGLHFDDCRHFFGKDEVKKFLDLMAYYKMNVFHWHLTDDQGWRLEIKAYPKITEVGSKRKYSEAMDLASKEEIAAGKIYGPFFYTQSDVKEILAYAKERFITVMPEIEFPGHMVAALAAYPELSCRGKDQKLEVLARGGIEKDVLCIGNPDAVKFLDTVIDEVCALFPDSPIIHIGGDECPKVRWKECPKCCKYKQDNGLEKEDWEAVQSHFMSRQIERIRAKGKNAIGWDEMFNGKVPKGTYKMAWRGWNRHAEGALSGDPTVVVMYDSCYYDSKQFPDSAKDYCPKYQGTRITLKDAYNYDPLFDPCKMITRKPGCEKWILGGECTTWSEYTRDAKELEWKTFPRALAMAEVLWTNPPEAGSTEPPKPQPKRFNRDFEQFKVRAARHVEELRARGVNCAPVEMK